MRRLIITIPRSNWAQCKECITQHATVISWKELGRSVRIELQDTSETDYAAFLQLLTTAFLMEKSRELCQAKCRDGSECNNTAAEEGYCTKHGEN